MEVVSVWAPPAACPNVCAKVNEWMRDNPLKPPYARFIQDYISSQWPVMWHLKVEYKVRIDKRERLAVREDAGSVAPSGMCAICHNDLGGAVEQLHCRHVFHSMCIHTWLRRANTCPMCRAVVCT